jgi:HAD superfamily phosphatase (TIGR01668 family)
MVSSVTDIPFIFLENKGIKGIIIDLDNTLTNWNCRFIPQEIGEWLKTLNKSGLRFCVVSNSSSYRIESTIKSLEIPFVANAQKPRKKAFIQAMEILNTLPQNTVVIGDQLFTDVLGGKRLGLTTILVTPRSKREFIGTKLVRILERRVLKNLKN